MTTIRHVLSYIFLFLFPIFEVASYAHLYLQRNDILTRKRNVSTVYLATLAGWLAYSNLATSLFGEGVFPCGVIYVASLLVPPLSVGPQLIRALTLRGTIRHSQLVIEDEISSREHRLHNHHNHNQKKDGRLSTVHDVEEGPSLPALVASSEKKIEADLIMAKTRRVVKLTKLALLVIPTILLVLTWTLSLGSDQLASTDFIQCRT